MEIDVSKFLNAQFAAWYKNGIPVEQMLAELERFKNELKPIDPPMRLEYRQGFDNFIIRSLLLDYPKRLAAIVSNLEVPSANYIMIDLREILYLKTWSDAMEEADSAKRRKKFYTLPTVEQFEAFFAEKEDFNKTIEIINATGKFGEVKPWSLSDYWTSSKDDNGNPIFFNMATGKSESAKPSVKAMCCRIRFIENHGL